MSKYKHIKDEWVREALDEYKDKIDENKSSITFGETPAVGSSL